MTINEPVSGTGAPIDNLNFANITTFTRGALRRFLEPVSSGGELRQSSAEGPRIG